MAEARAQRRLSAILAGDIAGYSRLMGADEEGTLATLKAHRGEFIDPTIAQHRGRIVKTTGDGTLSNFRVPWTRSDARSRSNAGWQNVIPPSQRDQRIDFRIGVNVGDIIIEGDDIFGDGVNIAARLEGIAGTGRIAISDDAYQPGAR